ncbi:MAG: ribokinase [Candidatus Hydrogenedentes bacterium]|nr:ribokinase [Candidatus Hydrogenedentota bacterium]
MARRNILVLGSANIDLVARVSRIPRPGETLIGQSFATICGGKGANQAVAAARLGAGVTFLGCVGADAFGDQQKASLNAAGVDLSLLRTTGDAPTGTAIIEVSDAGENSIVVVPGANFALTPADVEASRAAFEAADAVLMQLEVPVAVVEAALELARRTNTLSILDIGSDQPITPEILGKADVISPNTSEAERLTGRTIDTPDAIREAARAMIGYGARHVVMKLGDRGSQAFGPGGECAVPAFTVDVVDTTAAGDAFTAALGVAWDPRDLNSTLRFANAAGGLAATRAGAQPSLPDRAAVIALLERASD